MTFPQHRPCGRLVDDVAELIRERIVEGRYAPEAPLRQRHLAGELNVSRTVVGEALRTLDREGLVHVVAGQGIRVASGDRSILLSAYELREAIDGLAARLAAERGGPALARTLATAIDEQRLALEAADRRRLARANVAFHGAVIESSGNRLLLAYIPLLRWTSRTAGVLGARLPRSIEEHEAIAAAVCGGEPDEAEQAARAHIRTIVEAYGACIGAEREGGRRA